MEEIIAQVAAFFSVVNVLLLAGLIWIYASNLRRVRAQFTAALVFFAVLFLVQNLISLYSFLTMFMYYASEVGGLVLAITLVQSAGLGVMLTTGLR